MFLGQHEITPFLQLAILMSKSDGLVDESEVAFIEHLRIVHGLTNREIDALNDTVAGGVDLSEITSEISSRVARLYTVRELVALAHADGRYSDEEDELLHAICKEFAVSEEKLVEMDQWVRAGISWHKRGMEIIQETPGGD